MEYKICSKCQVEKPISEFYTHKRDGFQAWCKSCTYEYVKAWNKTPIGKCHRSNMSRRYRDDPNHEIILKSRRKLNAQIEMGNLERQPCVVCGDLKSQAHHANHHNPYDVMWLCELHHKNLHKEEKLNA